MADGVKVLAATGDSTVAPPVATDDIGGFHYQKIKLGFGPDGTFNEAEDASGKRIPVRDPSLAPATATDAGTGTGDVAITAAATGLRLMGFSARETTGIAGAVFNLRHGVASTDPILVTVSLGANESAREWYGPDGLAAASGIWLDRVSGTSQIVGYYKAVN